MKRFARQLWHDVVHPSENGMSLARDTRVGLVLTAAFALVFGFVVLKRLHQRPDETLPEANVTVAESEPDTGAPKQEGLVEVTPRSDTPAQPEPQTEQVTLPPQLTDSLTAAAPPVEAPTPTEPTEPPDQPQPQIDMVLVPATEPESERSSAQPAPVIPPTDVASPSAPSDRATADMAASNIAAPASSTLEPPLGSDALDVASATQSDSSDALIPPVENEEEVEPAVPVMDDTAEVSLSGLPPTAREDSTEPVIAAAPPEPTALPTVGGSSDNSPETDSSQSLLQGQAELLASSADRDTAISGQSAATEQPVVRAPDVVDPSAIVGVGPETARSSRKAEPPPPAIDSFTTARADGSSAAQRTYRVRRGDSLWTIARRVLGRGSRWKELYELNRDILPDPHHLKPGMVLKLPGPPAVAEKQQEVRTVR